MYERKRVFILVKTYPHISAKYAELVCTAGILEDGTWIRLYPIPFRMLKDDQKYKKYTWINVNAERNSKDLRVESYRPETNSITIEPDLLQIKGKTDWRARNKIILKNQKIYTNLDELIEEAKRDRKSLAIFKPSRIVDFTIKKEESEWDAKTVESLKNQTAQLSLFDDLKELDEDFRIAQKIPYSFRYVYEDDTGKRHKGMIEDWEIGMLYLNCLSTYGDEKKALEKVRKKYFDEFIQTDIYFFLGTTLRHHFDRNPFIIIGVYHPPFIQDQTSLFDE